MRTCPKELEQGLADEPDSVLRPGGRGTPRMQGNAEQAQ